MNDKVKKALESAITKLATKAENANTGLEAQQFSQATQNLANSLIGLTNLAQNK